MEAAVVDRTGNSALFQAEFAPAEGSYTFSAISPARAVTAFSGGEWQLRIPSEQTPLEGSPDESAQLLASRTTVPVLSGEVSLAFSHLTAYGRFSLTGLSLGGASMTSVELVSSAPLTGEWTLGGDDLSLRPSGTSGSVILHTARTDDIWFACAPAEMDGKTLTVIVHTDQGTISRDITLPQGTAFRAGHIAAFTVDMSGLRFDGSIPERLGTGLRSLFVTTPGGVGINSKEVWTENCSFLLVDDAGRVYYESDAVSLKGRGNSTWGYPKRPYAIKLPAKADLTGAGADKRWVLLANWMDRTLLRNEVSFEIARRCPGLEWTPSGEFVELFLNGVHQGNYWLGEKIKTGKTRLDADFLIEMDTYYDAQWRFYSGYGRRVNQNATGMPIGVQEPDEDEMSDALMATLRGLVDGVEKAIYLGTDSWQNKLDLNSFIDWYLVHEITGNAEPNHPKSCYFYFRGGRMYAGPVWDFDWYTFQPNTSGLIIPQSIYFGALMKDPVFVAALKARWALLKPLLADIPAYITWKADEIRASEAINWAMWPCTSYNVNGDVWVSFDTAVGRLKTAYSSRVSALDAAISAL